MDANATQYLSFLDGKKQYIVPMYQRTYSWTQPQCAQLWSDILRVADDDEMEGHFIGSIVYIQKGIYQATSIQRLLVIDGQQRLATLALLLVALAEAVEHAPDASFTREELFDDYLTNKHGKDDLRYKLLLTQTDRDTLVALIDGREPVSVSTRVLDTYRYFQQQCASGVDLDRVYRGIGKLILVDIALDRDHDNPQLIFESLNSTGLELSQADLIRNYILMGLDVDEQKALYERYWFPMERQFGSSSEPTLFDRFMRDYLTLKSPSRAIPSIGRVYADFKSYRAAPGQRSLPIAEVVADIARYGSHFTKLAFAQTGDRELDDILTDINSLKVDVAYPFLLELDDDLIGGRLSRGDFLTVLRLVESYIIRRAICDLPTNSLNKTFATFTREVDKGQYLDSAKAIFLSKTSYRRFPRDAEFRSAFITRNIYDLAKRRAYILGKLENYGHKERISVDDYTTEHILPQNENLSPKWRAELGTDWQQIQSRYLHTIGNLTLTGYNAELSDRPFAQKRDMPGGFAGSPLRLNSGLAQLEHWTPLEIERRAERLADIAVQIWPAPDLPAEALARLASVRAPMGSNRAYTLESANYAAFVQGNTRDLYQLLRQRILQLHPSVREEFLRVYIAYKTSTNFVDVIPQRQRLILILNMRFPDVQDPLGLCRDITNLGRWGNGDVELMFSDAGQIDDVMALIKQSYERHVSTQE